MELFKGMQQAVSLEKIPQGGYPFARNVVYSAKYRDVANEDGFNRIQFLSGRFVGVITVNDAFVIFTHDSTNNKSEIGYVDKDNIYTTIIKDVALNFNTFNPIEGVATFNFKRELIIAWWDGLRDDANVPRILNINCLPFTLNPDYSLVNSTDIDLLNLFAYINTPEIELVSVNDTGGNLSSGAYAFAIAYKLPDGNYSNFTSYSSFISIYDELATYDFSDIDGCIPDTLTSKSITIKISNLLTNYTAIAISITAKIDGILTTVIFNNISINDTSIEFTYRNNDNAINTAIEEIYVPTDTYIRAKTGASLDGRLYLSNLKKIKEFDYQPYANNIKLRWVREQDVNLGTYDLSYKNPKFIFDYRGFKTNEVYAFYIVFLLKDGTYSKAYHIPGRQISTLANYGNLPENSLIQDLINAAFSEPEWSDFISVDANVRYHEVYSTALQDGTMGFFENQDEQYKDTDCFDVKDSNGFISSIRNQKVRHHRFPSIEQLDSWGNPFYDKATGSSNTVAIIIKDKETLGTGNNWTDGSSNDIADFDISSINAAYFTATQLNDNAILTINQDFKGRISLQIDWKATVTVHATLTITRTSGLVDEIVNYNTQGNFIPQTGTVNFDKTFNFYTGDIITLSIYLPNAVTPKPKLTVGFSCIVDNFNGNNAKSRVLGFTFDDIYIPDEIKGNINGYQFCYALRTPTNSLKIVQAPYKNISPLGDKHKVYGFDIIINKPQLTPAYFKKLSSYTVTSGIGYYNTLYDNFVVSLDVRKITKFSYLPADVSIPYDNIMQGETLMVELANNLPFAATTYGFCELYNYFKNVYLDFTNQKLNIISTVFSVNTQTTLVPTYKGDTFIGAFGSIINESTEAILFVIESNDNISLRHDDVLNEYKYTPKFSSSKNPAPIFGGYYGYNNDYSQLNNILPILIFKCVDTCAETDTDEFPFRVARSTMLNTESNTIGWRKFLTNEYKEMVDRGKGEIWKIVSYNNSLIIYQKFSMFIATNKDLLATNGTDLYLGQGDIFDRDPIEVIVDGIGYAGNQSQWATVTCIHGVIHIDAQKGRVFLFTGKLEEISKKGMEHYFRDFGSISYDLDNPLLGNGYTMSYEERYNRLIICKRSDNPFTLSYSFDFGYWVAFHDYFPLDMFHTRKGLFAIGLPYSGQNDILWQYGAGNYGKFLEINDVDLQVVFRSYIESIIAEQFTEQKQAVSVSWLSTAFDEDDNELYDKTYTHALVYTRTQCSGEIILVNDKTLIKERNNIRNADYEWRLNSFRDLVINKDSRVLDSNGTLIQTNLDPFKAWFKQGKFIGRFYVVRLIYDNIEGLHILLKDVSPSYRKLNR